MEAVAGFGEEKVDGGLARFMRREGECHVERDEVNPMAVMAQKEEHGWR